MTKIEAIERDLTALREMVGVFCRTKHKPPGGGLCPDCLSLLEYATQRRQKCPYDPKPACKDCRTHCYRPEQRAKIREVMRFSGLRLLKHGRLDRLLGLLFRRRRGRLRQDAK
jgi:hypothetical protein